MPRCFVIMGFGKKTDPETGRELNLDATYQNIIKPAVEASGYQCIRADEELDSGVIDIPMYEMLLDADLVIADVSTSNLNAMFELGVRHALRPRSTIVIAESQFKSPFDINHIRIHKYVHLGPDIGYSEVGKMQTYLKAAIAAIPTLTRPDSPVYSLLNLTPPQRVLGAAAVVPSRAGDPGDPRDTHAELWKKVEAARAASDFQTEKTILTEIYRQQVVITADDTERPVRPRVVRELAFVTYKLGEKRLPGDPDAARAAYAEAIRLLATLDPKRTTDPETLGLWSAVHKRQFELPGRTMDDKRADLEHAILAAERGFLIRQDYYNGANLAFLFDLRASISDGNDRIADRVFADRVRRRVVVAAEQELELIPQRLSVKDGPLSEWVEEQQYWASATKAEALIGLNDPAGAAALERAVALPGVRDWMIDTTMKQIEKLRTLRAV